MKDVGILVVDYGHMANIAVINPVRCEGTVFDVWLCNDKRFHLALELVRTYCAACGWRVSAYFKRNNDEKLDYYLHRVEGDCLEWTIRK